MGEQPDQIVTMPTGQPADEKHALLRDLAKKISALDNPVKLNILSLLVESGSLSITDIAKKLDINFSTAHKYLEQLEASGLVKSKQVTENRLKRIFTIQDFVIELSPKSLFQKSSEANHKSKPKFKLFNATGDLVDFDEEKFAQKYIKRGMPRGTIILALQEILAQAYNGITLLELQELFRQALEKKAENISAVLMRIEDDLRHKRTFYHLLSVVHPQALKQHGDGDIFIGNLGLPKLLNFVFSLDRIITHGAAGKAPVTLRELFENILHLTSHVKSFADPIFGIDGFNYYASKFVKNLDRKELAKEIEAFLQELVKIGKFYISIEIGRPRYLKSAEFDDKLAEDLAKMLLSILSNKNYDNVYPIIKVWDKKKLKEDFSFLPKFYLVNMLPKWQTNNASFVGDSRFDYNWRGLLGTGKVGETQNITINLPRIALRSKNSSEFLQNLNQLVRDCVEYNLNMVELTVGQFLRKYKILLPSGERGHWRIVSAADCNYAISLLGLNEAKKILGGKGDKSLDPHVVVKNCLTSMKIRDDTPIRLTLKEECNKDVAKRFYDLDCKVDSKLKSFDKYSTGDLCGDFENNAQCHKMLLGGHACNLSREEYLKVLPKLDKVEFGCIKVI